MDSDDDSSSLPSPPSTNPVSSGTTPKSSSFTAYPVSRRKALSLQAEASRILNGSPDAQPLDAGKTSTLPDTTTAIVELHLPRRSERLAAQQSSEHDHLVTQSLHTFGKKPPALETERKAWITNEAFIPVKYCDLPPNANVIGSHTILKRQDCGPV